MGQKPRTEAEILGDAGNYIEQIRTGHKGLMLLYEAPDNPLFLDPRLAESRAVLIRLRDMCRTPIREFTRRARGENMMNALDRFRQGLVELREELGRVRREEPLLGIKNEMINGAGQVLTGYDGLRRLMEDPTIPANVKDKMIQLVTQERERLRSTAEEKEGKTDAISTHQSDLYLLFRLIQMMLQTIQIYLNWDSKGRKGKVPRLFVGCYTDEKRRKRPITVAIA